MRQELARAVGEIGPAVARRPTSACRGRSLVHRFAVGVLLASVALVQAPAPAQAATASTAPAFTALGRCLAEHHRLLLAFVLDESGSLGDASTGRAGTDPTGQRVTAAQVAVKGLTDLADRGVHIDVLLAGFSDAFHGYGDWQTLDHASSASIASGLDSFRSRDRGLDTDFYTAVAGAERALAAQAATTHDNPCEVVLLFTDGRYDVATTVAKPYDQNAADPDATKVAKGVAALCAANGPMDQIRKANGQTITLALVDPSAPSADQPDRAFLSRLATGDCSHAGAEYGASFDAANAGDLVDQFDAIVSSIRGGTQRLGDCVGTAHAFDVVPALSSFHVLADVGGSPQDVVISTPDHRQLRVSPSGAVTPKPDSVTVKTTVTSDRFIAIDASPARGTDTASAAWSGRWTVNFASANPGGKCQVFLFDGWKPVLRSTSLQPGRTAKLVVDVVDSSGRPADLGGLHVPYRVTASVTGASKSATPLTFTKVGDRFEADYAVPRSVAGRGVTVDAVFHVDVSGADVASSSAAVALQVAKVGAKGPTPTTTAGPAVRHPAAASSSSSSKKIRLVVAALLALVALGLLFLFVSRRRPHRTRGPRGAAFVEPGRLRTARVPVRIRRQGAPTRLTAGGAEVPLSLRDNDFVPCPVALGSAPKFSIDALTFEAVSRRRLFTPGHGEVSLPKQYVTASGGTALGSGFTTGRVPLQLRGTWVYELEVFDEGDDEQESFVDGYVTVFVAADQPIAPQAKKLVDSFNSFLSEIVLRLAKHAPSQQSPASAP